MTDELTPEERAALKNLPRERMPSAGLEDRVVGAMRDRGLLAEKRTGRVVRITTGRMAGLMAACVALLIGAYSIGLRRGDENDVIRSVAPVRDESTMEIEGVTEKPAKANEKNEAVEEKRQLARSPESSAKRKDEPVPTRDEGLSSAADRVEEKPASAAPKSALRTNQPPAPAAQMFAQESVAPSTVLQRTFQFGGATFIVDAPDSVRIVEDTEGRMLLIYTSDGLIRIRLAD